MNQRVIKFLAWDIDVKRMSTIVHLGDGIVCFPNDTLPIAFCATRTERFVFRQYTGLNDKDGREIYEGDIIRRWAKDWAESVSRGMAADRWDFLISFNGPFIGCVGTNANVHNPIDMEWSAIEFEDGANALDDCTVIGNIYQNPELLQQ